MTLTLHSVPNNKVIVFGEITPELIEMLGENGFRNNGTSFEFEGK